MNAISNFLFAIHKGISCACKAGTARGILKGLMALKRGVGQRPTIPPVPQKYKRSTVQPLFLDLIPIDNKKWVM